MKTLMKTRISLALVAMFVTLALVGPAAAELICPAAPEKGVPFHGTIQGVETDVVAFPTLSVDGSGTGIATHLGRFTVTWEFTVNLLTGEGIGSAHFIAANGDSVFTEALGQGKPTAEDPTVQFIVERHTITGGTGRFVGATGCFILERLLDSPTGFTSGSFDGTIVFHKAK